ncbi:SDR family oxidoreductase [Bacillus sp. AK031]
MRRIAIVTGASRMQGIGAAICLKLAEQGCDIFFTGYRGYDEERPWKADSEAFQILKDHVVSKGVRCEWAEVDYMSDNAHEKIIDETIGKLGTPSILINNAAYSTPTPVGDFTGSELDRHYRVNVRTPSLLTAKFIEVCRNDGQSRVIFLTSGQSLGPMPDELAYAMTKSSVEAFVKSASIPAAKKGITINAVNPGPTQTGWINKETEEELMKMFPMGRMGRPEDIANLIAFIITPDAQWITGQVIHSEGGFIR